MSLVVIGLGSMGKRRIRLLREMYPRLMIYGVDGREDRRKEAEELFHIKTDYSIEEASDQEIEYAFVCTAPLSHASIISECLKRKWHVFTELNLINAGYDENILLAKENGCTLFLSSTFLYREEIEYIKAKINEKSRWNYIYHTGQYLPDWHPWESVHDFFLGDKRTNGCREILAIELPWIINTFGEVTEFSILSDKMSGLDIDYQDNFLIQLQHANGNKGSLIVDVVSPVAVRNLEIYGENKRLTWCGTPDSLIEYSHELKRLEPVALTEEAEHVQGYSSLIVENAYRNEIREFFEVVLGRCKPRYGFEEDRKVLRLIDKIGA